MVNSFFGICFGWNLWQVIKRTLAIWILIPTCFGISTFINNNSTLCLWSTLEFIKTNCRIFTGPQNHLWTRLLLFIIISWNIIIGFFNYKTNICIAGCHVKYLAFFLFFKWKKSQKPRSFLRGWFTFEKRMWLPFIKWNERSTTSGKWCSVLGEMSFANLICLWYSDLDSLKEFREGRKTRTFIFEDINRRNKQGPCEELWDGEKTVPHWQADDYAAACHNGSPEAWLFHSGRSWRSWDWRSPVLKTKGHHSHSLEVKGVEALTFEETRGCPCIRRGSVTLL